MQDGRVCKATFGYTYYCPFWRKHKRRCNDMECECIHSYVNQNQLVTDEMLKRFRQLPGGARTKDSSYYVKRYNVGKTSRELANNSNNEMIAYNMMTMQHFQSQQVQITLLQQQLETNRAQTVIQTTAIQRQLIKCQQILAAERQKYGELYKSYNSLQNGYDSLQINYAVLDSKYIEIKNKLKASKMRKADDDEKYDGKQKKRDREDWRQWDFNDVYLWIISLNCGYFEKYGQIYQNLKAEKIDGSCLNSLDKADIHRIGIVEFRDKLLLLQNLKKLTNARIV